MTIGDRISYLRRSRDLSQEELAEMCGVSRQAVSKWESEQSIPEIDKITTLSEIFGVTTDFILKGIEPLGERPDRKNHPAKPYDIVGTALIILGTVIGCCFSATDYHNDLGKAQSLAAFGPRKYDILHAAAAKGLYALLAHYPADRVRNIALSRAVRAHYRGDPRVEIQINLVGEGLKALHLNAF